MSGSASPDSSDLQRVCERFEAELWANRQPVIEEFLSPLTPKDRSILLPKLLKLEWQFRVKQGQTPEISDYYARFQNDSEVVRLSIDESNAHSTANSADQSLLNTNHMRKAWADSHGSTEPTQDSLQPADDQPPPIGEEELVGRYRIIRVLGEGGFGRVYLADDPELKRWVAIKVPNRRLLHARGFLNQYRNEAQTLARFDHPNIVPVYDVGNTTQYPCFIVSKWIEGNDLARELQLRKLSITESARIIAAVADALNYAHTKKVVHRDIKPGNILLDTSGTPFVVDFGVALNEQHYGKPSGMVGTLSYMSPEQARGEGHLVDGRSDIFSLGTVFYKLLTGEMPFKGADRTEILERISRLEPQPPRQLNPQIPKEIERICLKALANRASERYATSQDMADDLQTWLAAATESYAPTDVPVVPLKPHDTHPAVSEHFGVVPKGLRCFDRQDADFFLNLVPGPRDRDGLPDSLRQWRTWVDQSSSVDTARVGLIYGPSGCGKSSLVRAGLVPILDSNVERIVIETSPDQTEAKLLTQVRDRFPDLPQDLSLSQTLAEHRRKQAGGSQRRLLIVLDQFEQWLHAQPDYEATELFLALRQCDGDQIKTLVLVRDDFFLSVSRFMSLLEIPLVQGQNMMLVDLFDPRHARKVLTMFGQAFERLPAPPNELSYENKQFLTKSISSLQSEGKIFPVRLALFADMVKGKPWDLGTVADIGGAEGIGTLFLEEAFSNSHSPANQKAHEQAARSVLETLLPEPGMQFKGSKRTSSELAEASGYADRPKLFQDLVQLLDFQLRLITPVDAQEGHTSESTESNSESYYQLSHDYLVPSIREWISRKQEQTFVGRLQLEFSDRAALFASMPERKLLPSWWQWLKYNLFLSRTHETDAGRKMMRVANRHFTIISVVAVSLIAIAAFGLYAGRQSLQASSVTNQLYSAEISEVPSILQKLKPYRSQAESRIQNVFDSSDNSKNRFVSALALRHWGNDMVDSLYDHSLVCQPDELFLVEQALTADADDVVDRYWAVLDDETANADHRFQASLMLAQFAPVSESSLQKWNRHANFIEDKLISNLIENPQYFSTFAELLVPVADVLSSPLSSELESDEEDSARARNKIAFLNRLYSDSPDRLLGLTLHASPWQLATTLAKINDVGSDKCLDKLRKQLAQPAVVPSDKHSERQARRVATAAALLAKHAPNEPVWKWLKRSSAPSTRSYFLHRLAFVGVSFDVLTYRLPNETDAGIRAALLMAMGEYEANEQQRAAVVSSVIDLYKNDPDPEVHSAAEWLLRKWKLEKDVKSQVQIAESKKGAGDGIDRRWTLHAEGFTFVRIDARGKPGIGRVFEIATKEVSCEQYQKFASKIFNRPDGEPDDLHYADEIAPTNDCPMNVITWFNAVDYCRELSESEGLDPSEIIYPEEIGEDWQPDSKHLDRIGYRLPTLDEWEFACGGMVNTNRHYGNGVELLGKYAWYKDNSGYRSWPCGSLKPNHFGLFDMLGNLREWCSEKNLDSGSERVVRSTAYGHHADQVFTTAGGGSVPNSQMNSYGFRLARTVRLE